jgi:hypothetical protein
MEMSTTVAQLAEALAKAQASITGAVKDSDNAFFHSKYADLATVWEACRAALTANKLAVVQTPRTTFSTLPEITEVTSRSGEKRSIVKVATTVELTTVLLHASGEWVSGTVAAMLANADPQSIGSACTYLRRYGLSSLVGIAQVDDDGNAAVAVPPTSEARKATAEQLPPSVQPASLLTLNDTQQIRLKGLMQQHGVKASAVKKQVEKTYPIKTAADILQKNYDDICAWIIAGGK